MLRQDWELVSPFAWLDTLADEEALMGGLEVTLPPSRWFHPTGRLRGDRQFSRGGRWSTRGVRDRQYGRGRAGERAATDVPPPKDLSAKWTDADFFADLPAGSTTLSTTVPATLAPPSQCSPHGDMAFCSYSYSTCLTVDNDGRLVRSTRRRFEDSSGRLKAVHRRQMGDRDVLEATWTRADAEAPRRLEEKVSDGSVDAFEAAWARTPFGAAEQRAKARGDSRQDELPDEPLAEEIAP